MGGHIPQDGVAHLVDDGQGAGGNLRVLVALALDPVVQRGDDAEIDVHGLEGGHRLIADVEAQGADGGGLGEVGRHLAQQAAGRLHPHQEAAGAGLHVPLHAGHLAGKGDAGVGFQPVVAVQQAGGIQIGVVEKALFKQAEDFRDAANAKDEEEMKQLKDIIDTNLKEFNKDKKNKEKGEDA